MGRTIYKNERNNRGKDLKMVIRDSSWLGFICYINRECNKSLSKVITRKKLIYDFEYNVTSGTISTYLRNLVSLGYLTRGKRGYYFKTCDIPEDLKSNYHLELKDNKVRKLFHDMNIRNEMEKFQNENYSS